jgi:hypothetical protein
MMTTMMMIDGDDNAAAPTASAAADESDGECSRRLPSMGLPPLLPDSQLTWMVDVVVTTRLRRGAWGGAMKHTHDTGHRYSYSVLQFRTC